MSEAKKRGRPATGAAMSNAEKQKAYRERKALGGCEDWRLRDAQVEIEFLKAHIGDLYKQMLEAGLKISTRSKAE